MSDRVKLLVETERGVETMWAEALGNGRYRIDNIPFNTYSLSWGDVVAASPKDGMLEFEALYEKSGERTVWVRIHDEGGMESATALSLFDLLKELGFRFEVFGSAKQVAISIPPGVDVEDKLTIPLAGYDSQKLDYEHADTSFGTPLPTVPGSPAVEQLAAIARAQEADYQALLAMAKKEES